MRASWAVILVGVLVVSACSGSSEDPPLGSEEVSISGTLEDGTVTGLVSAPLSDYSLFCVTFNDPPVTGSGTTDASGAVTLTINAKNQPIACFVLDSNQEPIATIIFRSGDSEEQTVTFTADADLGTITVDEDNGIATATVPSEGTLETPAAPTCPTGTWVTDNGPSPPPCSSSTNDIVTWLVVQPSADSYRTSFTGGPIDLSGGGCGYESEPHLESSWDGTALRILFPTDDPTCPAKQEYVVLTPGAGCTTATVTEFYDGCASCGGTNGCQGCGTTTCETDSLGSPARL